MISHFNDDRLESLRRLSRGHEGEALLAELREQHTATLGRLAHSADDRDTHQLQGAARTLERLIDQFHALREGHR